MKLFGCLEDDDKDEALEHLRNALFYIRQACLSPMNSSDLTNVVDATQIDELAEEAQVALDAYLRVEREHSDVTKGVSWSES